MPSSSLPPEEDKSGAFLGLPPVRDFVEADFGHFPKMTICKSQNLLKDLPKGLDFVEVKFKEAQTKKFGKFMNFQISNKNALFKLF